LAWVPPIEDALLQLPENNAHIRAGQLTWPTTNSVLLGERPQLAIGVTPTGGASLGQGSDVQFDFQPNTLRVRGLLGFTDLAYPPELDLPLSRTGGRAAWDAWRSPLLVAIGILTVATQFVAWTLISLIYTLPVWGLTLVSRRSPGVVGTWKLCGAGLLPATWILFATLLLYSKRVIPPIGLGIGAVIFLLTSWGGIGGAVIKLSVIQPPTSSELLVGHAKKPTRSRKLVPKKNPFTNGTES
jgi:hypothetical protein